jgi:hypothetical protein
MAASIKFDQTIPVKSPTSVPSLSIHFLFLSRIIDDPLLLST